LLLTLNSIDDRGLAGAALHRCCAPLPPKAVRDIDDRGNLHDLKHKGTLWYLMKVGLHANVFDSWLAGKSLT